MTATTELAMGKSGSVPVPVHQEAQRIRETAVVTAGGSIFRRAPSGQRAWMLDLGDRSPSVGGVLRIEAQNDRLRDEWGERRKNLLDEYV